jgi:D-beta-D-heptose 7-phosphate kinase/D-beta-D-heptose 1-phosphate adenosyltransferase
MSKKYFELISKFEGKKILVIGDAMLDKYIHGIATRISPEAPVPVLLKEKEEMLLGGAANVAADITSLKAKALLLSVIGEDADGEAFIKLAKEKSINTSYLYRLFDRPTTVKLRILATHQQIVRIDSETDLPVESCLCSEIVNSIREIVPKFDGIVISDYGKGFIVKDIIRPVIEIASKENIPVVVDPKPNNWENYKGASILTPNHKEAEEIAGFRFNDDASLEKAGRAILEKTECNHLVITLGENGMALFSPGEKRIDLPTKAKSVFDVTGAGDLVASLLCLGLSCGFSLYDSAYISNVGAGIQVGKLGNVNVGFVELQKELSSLI